mgnify:CR=1 FL=1
MKRFLVALLSLTAASCATNPDVAMKIEKSPSEFKILIGEFDGSLALIHGSPKNAEIQATDGSFTCIGKSTTGEFSTDFRKNKVRHLFNFTCDDGSTGQVILIITMWGNGQAQGVGTGVLSNGSKIKVVVGDMSGTLSW